MLVNDRLKLRLVCRSWRYMVDNFKSNRLVAFCGFKTEEPMSIYDLIPYYTNKMNNPKSLQMLYKHELRARHPKIYEIVKKVDKTENQLFLNGYSKHFKSIVFHFDISSAYKISIDWSEYEFAENLEFYNHHYLFYSCGNNYYNGELLELVDCPLPCLRRLVTFGCIFPNPLQRCRNLKVLKVNRYMLTQFFKEVKFLRATDKVVGLKKLNLEIDYRPGKYLNDSIDVFEQFVSHDVMQVLPELEKLTLLINLRTLEKVTPDFPFFRIPRISLRLWLLDHDDPPITYQLLKQFLTIIQNQLELYSFEININGYPISIKTNIGQLSKYLTDFLFGARINESMGIDTESADRFRSSIYYKTNHHFLNSFNPESLTWSFLSDLNITVPVSQHLLNCLPKYIPRLRCLNICLTSRNDTVYDISFASGFRHLIRLFLRSFKIVCKEKALRKIMTEMESLKHVYINDAKMKTKLFRSISRLVGLRHNIFSININVKCDNETRENIFYVNPQMYNVINIQQLRALYE